VRIATTLIAVFAALGTACAGDDESYEAVFASGKRVVGAKLSDWDHGNAKPKLDGDDLMGGADHLRWFSNRFASPANHAFELTGYVEFVGGDRLPGRVVGFVDAAVGDGQPAHLLIDNRTHVDNPKGESQPYRRVKLDLIQRISRLPNSRRQLSPGNVYLLDGRQLEYRGLRWSEDSVQFLTDDDMHDLSFTEIAEIHLRRARQDPPSRLSDGNLLRIETADGLIVTSLDAKFDALAIVQTEDRMRIEDAIQRLTRRRATVISSFKRVKQSQIRALASLAKKRKTSEAKVNRELKKREKQWQKLPEDQRKQKLSQTREQLERVEKQRLEADLKRVTALSDKQSARVNGILRDVDRQIAAAKQSLPSSREQPETWRHSVYPTWSLDPLWARFDSIKTRSRFTAHELPLTWLSPTKVDQRSSLGPSWTWQRDRNVLRQQLRSNNNAYGWGFGVHGDSQLQFELPLTATSFRTQIGLDDLVGTGGCVRASIYLNSVDSEPLFRSDMLIGSRRVIDTGWLQLPVPFAAPRTLILVTDSAHQNRPPHTDPLDIRDHLNWLEPLLKLDLPESE
jgi:hypothetical protein